MSRMAATLLVGCILATSNSYAIEVIRYSTEGHPKAKGISLAVKYPADWKTSEGERPNIVQRFSKSMPGYAVQAQIQIMQLPAKVDNISDALTLEDWRETLSDLGQTSNILKTQIEAETAYMADITSGPQQRAGLTAFMQQRIISFFYEGRWVWLWCGITSLSAETAIPFQRHLSECQLYFNSVVLTDKWQR